MRIPRAGAVANQLKAEGHEEEVQKKVMWLLFFALSTAADFMLPLMWGLLASIPILLLSWWIAYRSGWIE